MTTTRFCCCSEGGGGGGDPCNFAVGVRFESTYNATNHTNSAVRTVGGDLTVSDNLEDMVYDDLTDPLFPGWYGSIVENWSLADFTIGLSQFSGFTQTNSYSIRLVKQASSSAITVYSPTIGAGNSKITIVSNNDNGYIVFVRSLLHDQFDGTIYNSVPMTLGGCPILPISKGAATVTTVEVYYRNAFGVYVSDTLPTSSQYFKYSGFTHTLDVSEV